MLTYLDQLVPRAYNQILLCLPIDSTSQDKVIEILQAGYDTLTKQYPFLLGTLKIIQEEAPGQKKGQLLYKDSATPGQSKKIIVKEWPSINGHTYAELHEKGMPMSLLPQELIPFQSVSEPTGDISALQVNFIPGGIILCLAIYHSIIDGIGYGYLVNQLAHNCRAFTTKSADISQVIPDSALTLNRESLLEGKEMDWKSPEFTELMKDLAPCYIFRDPSLPPPPHKVAPLPADQKRAVTFTLSANTVNELKTLISTHSSFTSAKSDAGISWISTNDALCSLIWCASVRAMLKTTTSGSDTTSFGYPISTRRCKGLHPKYPFNGAVRTSSSPVPISKSTFNPPNDDILPCLAKLAAHVRGANEAITPEHVNKVLTLGASMPNRQYLLGIPGIFLDGDYDLVTSTWTWLPLYEADFGPGIGSPQWVRIGPKRTFKSAAYIMPKKLNGDIEVIIGLEINAMNALLNDQVFMKYVKDGEWIE